MSAPSDPEAAALQTSAISLSVASGIHRLGEGDRDVNPVGGAHGPCRTITISLHVSYLASTPSSKFEILTPNFAALTDAREEELAQTSCLNAVVHTKPGVLLAERHSIRAFKP